MRQQINIYLKGIVMGISDLIPGISGGTIAFITGIYERLINAIKHITPKNYFKYTIAIITNNKKQIKILTKDLDIIFLITLFAGIFTSILLGARGISYLYENHTGYVLTFFLGLIISSVKIIHNEIQEHKKINFLYLEAGILIGLLFLFIIPKHILSPSIYYVALGGFLAIMALFLPGISGSFILLILGLYEHIIGYVKDIRTQYLNLVPFAIGALAGVYIISRVISYLFDKDKSKTLYALLGLVIGSLSILIQKIISNTQFNLNSSLTLIIILILGTYIGLTIQKLK